MRFTSVPYPTPLVSVVIPLYNAASTLERAVNSVLQQSLASSELLIVNDGSRDASLEVARRCAAGDRRIRIIALTGNHGKSYAMNRAIGEASGTWIAVLDADDWYEPDRLATLVDAAARHGVSMAADNQRFYDAGAGCVIGSAWPMHVAEQELTRQRFIAGSNPYASFSYGMLKPVLRADFIRTSGLAYRENVRLAEDFLYLVEFFAAGGTGILISRPLYNWTQPFGSRSRQWTTTGAGSWRYEYRSALVGCTDVLRALYDRHDHSLAALVVGYLQAFRRLHYLNEIRHAHASGAPLLRVLCAIARRPSIWPHLAARVLLAGHKRLLGTSAGHTA
jgi:succinoglycan biosynthesis protein ExoO